MLFLEKVDVVVTDGFTGNVFLKSVEGLGKFVKRSLTESLTHNLLAKICALPKLASNKKIF